MEPICSSLFFALKETEDIVNRRLFRVTAYNNQRSTYLFLIKFNIGGDGRSALLSTHSNFG